MSTNIGWCDITINPFVGCSKCSPGCDHCYAERFAARLSASGKGQQKEPLWLPPLFHLLPQMWDARSALPELDCRGSRGCLELLAASQ